MPTFTPFREHFIPTFKNNILRCHGHVQVWLVSKRSTTTTGEPTTTIGCKFYGNMRMQMRCNAHDAKMRCNKQLNHTATMKITGGHLEHRSRAVTYPKAFFDLILATWYGIFWPLHYNTMASFGIIPRQIWTCFCHGNYRSFFVLFFIFMANFIILAWQIW
jgi:hypothetical protein